MSAFHERNFTLQSELLVHTIDMHVCRERQKNGGCAVTQNQIAFQSLLETQRANRAREGISSREAAAKEREAGVSERKAAVAERDVTAKEQRYAVQNYKDKADVSINSVNAGSKLISAIGGLL